MQAKHESNGGLPKFVEQVAWRKALDDPRVEKNAVTRAHDALDAERQRLPMARIDQDYVFVGPTGKVALSDLCEGRRQLILYHLYRVATRHGEGRIFHKKYIRNSRIDTLVSVIE